MTLRLSEEEYAELMRQRKAGRAATSSDPPAAAHLPLKATSKNPVFANNTSQGTLVLQGFPK